METPHASRYQIVSRRAMLKASLGAGFLATAAACGTKDSEVFLGAVAAPVPTTTTTSTTTTIAPSTTSTTPASEPDAETTTSQPAADAASEAPLPEESQAPEGDAAAATGVAVAGEMVIEFTYTRAVGGKLESPYVAVWIENDAGELLETVALFYQQRRRGARWLDHLHRWFNGDAARIATGGADVAATISSATRPPGYYTVAWDGTVAGMQAPAGSYHVFIESAREDGPVSLTSTPVMLAGSLPLTALPDDGELSLASVRVGA